jgi:hypothetical protein
LYCCTVVLLYSSSTVALLLYSLKYTGRLGMI